MSEQINQYNSMSNGQVNNEPCVFSKEKTQATLGEPNNKKSFVKQGYFNVKMKSGNEMVNVTVPPLTQHELSDGWRLVLPRQTKKSYVHHFSIYLSQLPPHLWSKLRSSNMKMENYNTIKDNIYHYTVKKSNSDEALVELYHELMKTTPNKEVVTSCYSELEESSVKGWIMLKAKRYM
jgi:hypothetical protein